MKWFDEPPSVPLTERAGESSSQRLVLEPWPNWQRGHGSIVAAMGGTMAALSLRMARLVPGAGRLLALGMSAIGGGMVVGGVLAALASHRVEVERGRGLTLHWRYGRKARCLEIPVADIRALELRWETHTFEGENHFGNTQVFEEECNFRIAVVTRGGREVFIDVLATRDQAEQRRRQIAHVLGNEALTR